MNPPEKTARFLPTLTEVYEPRVKASEPVPASAPGNAQTLLDTALAQAETRLRAAAEHIIQEQLDSMRTALQREFATSRHPGENSFSAHAALPSE